MMTLSRRALSGATTLVGLALMLPGAPAAAQAGFPWAEERPGFMDAKYDTPGMCFSAFGRVERDEQNKIPFDTLWANREPYKSPLAMDTLKRCRKSLKVAALADKRDFPSMVRVLLEIGDSAGYFELLDRRIALYAEPYDKWEPRMRYPEAYASSGTPHREDMSATLPDVFPASDSSVKIMRAIGPLRLVDEAFRAPRNVAWREHVLKRYRHLFSEQRAVRYRMVQHMFLLDSSIRAVDTASWRARLAVVVAFADSMTKANITLVPDEWNEIRSLQIQTALRLDSLPVTNADIWPRQVANVYKTFAPEARPEGMLANLGTTAPPLSGTFWYRASGRGGDSSFTKMSSAGPLPAPGRWSLVVRVPRLCDGPYCALEFSWVRRFKQRYGEKLDVTLVTSTQGYFLTMEPPTPEQEADAVARLLFGFYKLPGVLAVTETKSTRIPAPDSRWMVTGTPESDRGGYTAPPLTRNGMPSTSKPYAVLVDPQGRVMLRTEFFGGMSDLVSALFDVLIK